MFQNVLLIHEDPAHARAVQDALLKSDDVSFRVQWVRRCAEALEQLIRRGKQEERTPDGVAAVVVDLFLSDSQGIETFDRLFEAAPQIPILIVTSARDEDVAKLAVQRGAQDYLLKRRFDGYMLPKTLGNMLKRAAIADALFDERERAQVTLNSIGDAVVSTDVTGRVAYLNVVAETMTGWSRVEAAGRALEEVVHIIDAKTRTVTQNPILLAIRENKTVGLNPNCILIRRDGTEAGIEDSAAPIHDRQGHVTGAVMVFHDVSASRAMSEKMSYLAQYDSLTDLPNRILLKDRLSQSIALADRYNRKIALLYVDVDRFKSVNDSLGHSVGDLLLQSVAQRLRACVRSTDTVSRQGGDEFVVLLSDAKNSQDASVSADKMLQALSEPHRIAEHELAVTASIGIATYPDDATEPEALIRNADFALLHAKNSGRNNYQYFKPDMNARSLERHSLEIGLRHALEREEFVLHYQPKINLKTGAIVGVEALIRWCQPDGTVVSPSQFIPVAEECGFIVPISHWVLREGCRQARTWQDEGLSAAHIAINISAAELRSKGFVAGVAAILTETGLAPRHLELELTETFLMQDSRATAAVLHELKELGVSLALDDFGTGYSSLSYLKRFPINTLKIDRSFVLGLASDADDASIVSAVISMGKSLHMQVVAEGVETREHLKFLQEHNCPQGQGYYFSRPVVAAQITGLLRQPSTQVAAAA